jgi:steroid 5-alpha reductase family enzyme
MFIPFLVGGVVVLAAFTVLWIFSLARRDVSIVDIYWGPGFVLAAAAWSWHATEMTRPRWLYLGLLTLWGLRLALHIGWRHKGEDKRYGVLRAKSGSSFAYRSLLTVFWLQAVLVALIGLPLLWILLGERPAHLVGTDYLALALFALGFVFEAVGDWQLTRFQADPGNWGKVLCSGLWRYSRHPNYFGDAVVWWSFYCGSLASEGGWMTLPSALLMTVLLLKVSGVTLLERTIVDRRPEYRDYIETTPAFIPCFRRRHRR